MENTTFFQNKFDMKRSFAVRRFQKKKKFQNKLDFLRKIFLLINFIFEERKILRKKKKNT